MQCTFFKGKIPNLVCMRSLPKPLVCVRFRFISETGSLCPIEEEPTMRRGTVVETRRGGSRHSRASMGLRSAFLATLVAAASGALAGFYCGEPTATNYVANPQPGECHAPLSHLVRYSRKSAASPAPLRSCMPPIILSPQATSTPRGLAALHTQAAWTGSLTTMSRLPQSMRSACSWARGATTRLR